MVSFSSISSLFYNSDLDNEYLLHAKRGNLYGVRTTLAAGANPYAKVEKRASDYFQSLCAYMMKNPWNPCGESALHLAARKGHVEIVKELLEKHEKMIHLKDNEGETPLFWAHNYCIPLLLKHKVDLHHKNIRGQTALYSKIAAVDYVGVKLLLEHETGLKEKRAQSLSSSEKATINPKDVILPKRLLKLVKEGNGSAAANAVFKLLEDAGIDLSQCTLLETPVNSIQEMGWAKPR